jgi:hypothetical protein
MAYLRQTDASRYGQLETTFGQKPKIAKIEKLSDLLPVYLLY